MLKITHIHIRFKTDISAYRCYKNTTTSFGGTFQIWNAPNTF
jgi:hypothetical protein